MKKMKKLLFMLLTSVTLSVQADEGMWVMGNLSAKTDSILRSLGFEMTPEELYSTEHPSLNDAIVQLGGFCSGVVVSPDGLMFTNHHCGFDAIQDHSTPKSDYLKNGFFAKKQVKYFGVISDRADRLMSKASQLLEYAQQVRDAYKAQVDAQQNNNMQFLTVISTIFFPLTLITSWYGMNFHNMPELKHGYPGVIILSVVVMITCIIIFKRKKML